ncbi:Surfeit locus 1 [Macrophomina phaseolina MS6]|uniref:SURF1-like protein n=1 Tax=Macrophomina phaseolina (strain MS6) TaxID=1126212 RepID=K2RFG5_MACPH|nr:Surfeit locus 1 [Macrophomina phaseolina MS6]
MPPTMSAPHRLLRQFTRPAGPGLRSLSQITPRRPQWRCPQCAQRPQQPRRTQQCRFQSTQQTPGPQPGDDPTFSSIVDQPAQLVKTGRRHGPGLIILALIPITAFALGTWQVQRLGWKTDLIARFEDRLIQPPLPLPPRIDPTAIADFDYRRVYATGMLNHDKEMLVGPRLNEGEDGYLVITPLERTDARGGSASILVNRGWIPKTKKAQRDRDPAALPRGEVTVQGLLREPWKKNTFTPDNQPARGVWYFPDVEEMAEWAGAQPVWIEETMKPDLIESMTRADKGIPIGRAAEVNLRNNHTQYIFTWYALSAATSVMLWMVIKKPAGGVARRVRQSREW